MNRTDDIKNAINAVTSDSASPSHDSFGRIRVSETVTIFDNKFLFDKLPDIWDEEIIGAATSVHSVANAQVLMSTDTSGQAVIRQTRMRFNYQSGKSHLIMMTGVLSVEANITKRIGYFTSSTTSPYTANFDGIYFEADGSTVNCCIAKTGTINSIPKSSWNLDKLDGNGPSGVTIDFSKTQIFIIDFQWLGVGTVRFGFSINGEIIYVHEVMHSNILTSVYMSSPNQAVRYEIRQTGAGTGSLQQICSTVMSEGGNQKFGKNACLSTNNSYVSVPQTNEQYAVLGIRLKSGYEHANITPQNIQFVGASDLMFRWMLCLNPHVSGNLTFNSIHNSFVDGFISSDGPHPILSSGTVLQTGYGGSPWSALPANNIDANYNENVRIGVGISGVKDTLYLVVSPFSGSTVTAAMNFKQTI